ncbi:MAG: PPOX class F420-dependent oxidoreductase [Acidimicrobiales bacterium]
MELSQALEFAAGIRRSVFVTLKADGRPQLSNVLHVYDGMSFRISTTADRAKYRNLVRSPWAALHVTRDDFFAYAVIEGSVELSAVASDPHDAAVDELVEYYRAANGEHEDWDAYRRAMVADRRVMVRLTPERSYGMLGG